MTFFKFNLTYRRLNSDTISIWYSKIDGIFLRFFFWILYNITFREISPMGNDLATRKIIKKLYNIFFILKFKSCVQIFNLNYIISKTYFICITGCPEIPCSLILIQL